VPEAGLHAEDVEEDQGSEDRQTRYCPEGYLTLQGQWYYNGVTRVLQGCCKSVRIVLQWCYIGVRVVFQWQKSIGPQLSTKLSVKRVRVFV
jgi:hypothetical protein